MVIALIVGFFIIIGISYLLKRKYQICNCCEVCVDVCSDIDCCDCDDTDCGVVDCSD